MVTRKTRSQRAGRVALFRKTKMVEHGPDYEEGVREGRLRALEMARQEHHERLDKHERRLTALERVAWALLGASALLQFPQVLSWLKAG